MAFRASQVNLQTGLTQLLQLAVQEKAYLANWAAALTANVDAFYVLGIEANLVRVVPLMDSYAGLSGMAAYAQAQYGDATYNIVTEYNAMKTALTAIATWLIANIPSNAITVTNGVQVGATFTPTQTAPLLALVNAAAATIS